MRQSLFRIKICGVKRDKDVIAVADSGADAIGFNFFPPSIRFLETNDAIRLNRLAQESGLFSVGVFVNEPVDRLLAISRAVGLNAIQLHGDESLDFARSIDVMSGIPVLRAVRLPRGEISPEVIDERTKHWLNAGFQVLLDADAGIHFGGSGEQLDWNAVRAWNSLLNSSGENSQRTFWTLAGGLNLQNVGDAIRSSGTKSVDVASGVERERGVKDAALIREFVQVANPLVSGR